MVRGLRKYLTPFAPDQSGAVSVLYDLGGLVVILDAGGCTGNICGFDEPRWSSEHSAVFSAGLRDMDAIMGRDRELVKKIAAAQEKLHANFVAIIGTPVPAVIGTDYQALRRMLEKQVSVPVLTIETNGMKSWEYGAEKAYLALLSAFAFSREEMDNAVGPENQADAERIGVFGTFPMAESCAEEWEWICNVLNHPKNKIHNDYLPHEEDGSHQGLNTFYDKAEQNSPTKISFYGHGASVEDYASAGQNMLNLATSVPGLAAAKELQKHFGTPCVIGHPAVERLLQKAIKQWISKNGCVLDSDGKNSQFDASILQILNAPINTARILIIHEQIFGNSLRDILRNQLYPQKPKEADFFSKELSSAEQQASVQSPNMLQIHVMSFFKMEKSLQEPGDRHISEEQEAFDVLNLPQETAYDLIISDRALQRMLPKDFRGVFLEIPEPAVSGFAVYGCTDQWQRQ